MNAIVIRGKSLGSRKKLFEDFSVPISPAPTEGGFTLRDLIETTVRQQVKAFHERQENRKFIRVLTEREIEDGAAKGKIDSGGSDNDHQPVNPDQAVATAIEAFEDGLYLVSIDDQECRSLDAELFLNEQSQATFIRLTMLAGG